jgi:triphosphoribosyl-dephospho-CoA synthase
MFPLTNDKIAWAAQIACLLEVCAEKPGNVTRHKDFNDTCFEDFAISAAAIGPAFQRAADAPVGETIIQAVRATRRFVGVNTNLGIVLLLAPLAKAAGLDHSDALRLAVGSVLKSLTVDDARLTYEAIRLARPAGMGTVQHHDLQEPDVDITLRQAMGQARDRDALAREYVTDFEITFEVGLNALQRILEQGAGMSEAVVQTFLTILTQVPDTLIARKNGMDAARKVSGRAGQVLKCGGIFSAKGKAEIKRFDLDLRDKGHTLNPGTTADLTAAVLFAYLVENDLPQLFQSHQVPPADPASVQ